jgi:HEAT repeat protein
MSKCGRAAVGDLIQLLKPGGEFIAKALGDIGPDASDAIPALLESIDESASATNLTSARAIGQIGGAPELIKALDHKPARFSVIQALIYAGPAARDAIPRLLEILKTDDRPNVRNSVTWVLRRLGPHASDAVPALVELLEEQPASGSDIRHGAVEALESIGPAARKAVPALVKLIKSAAPDWLRAHAAVALSAIDQDHPLVLQTMVEILKLTSNSPWIERFRAIQVLEKLGPAAAPAVPLIIRELNEARNSRNSITISAAVMTVGAIGPDASDAVPVLIELLKTTEPHLPLLINTIRALGSIGPAAKDALPQLVELAKDTRINASRSAIIQAIERIDIAGHD